MEQYDIRVDAYIEKSAAFAQPILNHIRQVVHAASPLITENIKWGMPFFEYKGAVCMMAAFKQHCGFGFWKSGRLEDPKHLLTSGEEASAGSFGRITSIGDLPGDADLKGFVLQLIKLNKSGVKEPIVKKVPPPKNELVISPGFIAMLSQNPKAQEVFDNFSYSHKKEYLQWITEAKTEATREKRMIKAVEMIAERKSRHSKYQ